MYGKYGKEIEGGYRSLPAWKHTLILGINFLGFAGATLVVYGIGVVLTGETYGPFERYAGITSDILTLVGVLLTAASVYGPPNTRKPDKFSTGISAPIVIIAVLGTLYILLFTTQTVPDHVVKGFALLGLAGGLFRTISRA